MHPSGVRALAGAVKLSMRKWWSRQQPASAEASQPTVSTHRLHHVRQRRGPLLPQILLCAPQIHPLLLRHYILGELRPLKTKKGGKEAEGALDLSPWVFHAGFCAALCTRRLSSWQHRGVRVVTAINVKGKTLNHCFILSFSLWWEGGGCCESAGVPVQEPNRWRAETSWLPASSEATPSVHLYLLHLHTHHTLT